MYAIKTLYRFDVKKINHIWKSYTAFTVQRSHSETRITHRRSNKKNININIRIHYYY